MNIKRILIFLKFVIPAVLASIILITLWVVHSVRRRKIIKNEWPLDLIEKTWNDEETLFQDNKRAYDDPDHPSYNIKNYKTRLHWIWGIYQKPRPFKPVKLL